MLPSKQVGITGWNCWTTPHGPLCTEACQMTKLRTSDVSDEAVLFREEPVELFGARVRNVASPGERGIGWFRSMGQGASIDGFGYARDQWWTLKDFLNDPESQRLTE